MSKKDEANVSENKPKTVNEFTLDNEREIVIQQTENLETCDDDKPIFRRKVINWRVIR